MKELLINLLKGQSLLLKKPSSHAHDRQVCAKSDNNTLTYNNQKYIPAFVTEVVEEWRQNFLNRFEEPLRKTLSVELATYGPNYLLFTVDEDQSKIANIERKNSSFRLTIRTNKPDLANIENKIRESFSVLSPDKQKLISISGDIKKNPTDHSYSVTFTLPKSI